VRYHIKSVATAAALFFTSFYAFSFQDSIRHKRDSLREKIQFIPYFTKQSPQSLGNYVAVVDDTLTFLRSAGISVLNTLRDVVPNSGISAHAPFATVRHNALFIIDGIPYEEGPGIYNPNTFDYRRIIALNRGNAASVYGLYSGNGAFLIESKTGENHTKPTIEFSSYTTVITEESKTSSFYLSNAVAYMQDYGKVDTRISYSHVALPSNLGNANNIKVNTGFNVSPTFKARLILDNVYMARKSSSYSSSTSYKDSLLIQDGDTSTILYDPYIVETHRRSRANERLFRGNLSLQYQPFMWLTFTSQSSWGKVSESDRETINTQTTTDEDKYTQSLANIFARIDQRLGANFAFSSFVGFQHQAWENKSSVDFDDTNPPHTSESSHTTKSLITALDLNVGEFLYGRFIYRKDLPSFYPSEGMPTYSTSLAFVFSEAFGWQSSFFSFGKVRGSLGKTHVQIQNDYNNFPTTPERLIETGTDLFFFKNRFGITFNYFKEKLSSTRSYSPSSGYVTYFLYPQNMRTTGSELVLTAFPIRTHRVEYKAVALWMKTKSRLEGTLFSGNVPGLIVNSFPNWTGSLFNQLRWKNFSWSFLIDMRKGDTVGNGGYNSSYTAMNGSQIKLRDISFGWYIARLRQTGFKQVHLSVSARNAMLLYSSSGRDVEETMGSSSYNENVSLGLSFLL
jgi:hypothetical protein